ncbi:protein-glutamate methylesterase/protein-glutamine glutaminase [Melittangium boletus]|uniref:Protein-glutamate methylesterase/protein-glutamine glutaminase n=1 Tax=Melittangium boletus DSM 14713 TaxID=1294270 RepID=A0A250IMD9_9BACT|nr:chemotaxis response regulator protein-glutamate methylesterase [Melittangium boletus]ATB32904.1 chemotaxis response regulator protein-glutamate methylesterase [Melittangium boletus DSM 14713]
MASRLRVLVVDGSAVTRQGLMALLAGEPGVEVIVASTPAIARQKLKKHRPDVLLLGLDASRMGGLTFLGQLTRQEEPTPVVVVCSDSEASLRARHAGAAEVITRPVLGEGLLAMESRSEVVEALRRAAGTRRTALVREPEQAPPRLIVPPPLVIPPQPQLVAPPSLVMAERVVAVGASTGGTEALREFLEPMPPDCPGIVIVQHMPEAFTGPFARRLDSLCRIEVREAKQGDRVTRGRALIAPGNRHLRVRRGGGHYQVDLMDSDRVSGHRPSVDVLFLSVAKVVGADAVGVLLTGMGEDGAEGLLAMKRAGAVTFAQDEASCVVFGMPRVAIALGAVDEVLPLSAIGEAVRRRAQGYRRVS